MPKDPAADDRGEDSVNMVEGPADGDPADMTGEGASATAEKMVGESDEIAENADR